MKSQSPLLVFLTMAVLGALGLQVFDTLEKGSSPHTEFTSPDALREYASELKANQLYQKSARVYDEYLEAANLSGGEKANIDFNTGRMLLDQVGDAEEALARFLRVTHLYSEVDPEIKKEARKLSAQCLEVLGRSGAAERQLVAATQLGAADATSTPPIDEKEILATIGARVSITRNDFEEIWKEIPPQVLQQQFPGENGKKQFLQEMVVSKLFAEAARRKGYDRDPQLRRRVLTLEESLLANQLLEEEVAAKVQFSESDLQIFFEANKAHYSDPVTVEVAHILLPDATQAQAALAEIEAGSPFEEVAKSRSLDTISKTKGGTLGPLRQQLPTLVGETPVEPMDISIPGMGKEPAFVSASFAVSEIGEITGPVQTSKGFHLIKLLNRSEPKEKDFNQVKPLVERDLRARKQTEKQAELVAELMKTHKVRVHEERLN